MIVPVYNAPAAIAECLDSLLRLDYPAERVQILCVDNASSDTTPAVLARYAGRVIALHESKRGPAAARNRGLRHATGDFIALTDSDCIVDRAWLGHLVAAVRAPDVAIAGGTILSRRPCNAIEAYGEQIHDHDRAIHEYDPPYVITMNWCARRALFDEVGTFNEDLVRASDVDFSFRVLDAGHRLAYAPDAIVYHRNERTPWGLMREGYVHAYHAVALRSLHGGLRERLRQRGVARAPVGPWHPNRLPAPRSTPLWSYLFELGKRIGRRRAAARPSMHAAAAVARPSK